VVYPYINPHHARPKAAGRPKSILDQKAPSGYKVWADATPAKTTSRRYGALGLELPSKLVLDNSCPTTIFLGAVDSSP